VDDEASKKVEQIGCCGAYCGTCPVIREGACRGCKLGYATGGRDPARIRCRIKKCCLEKRFNSCADCPEYEACPIIQAFHSKTGYKYRKYREAILFIREHGYEAFLACAREWTAQYGKYPKN
jgi:hypothetical protein